MFGRYRPPKESQALRPRPGHSGFLVQALQLLSSHHPWRESFVQALQLLSSHHPWRESFVQALQLLSSHSPWRASFARALQLLSSHHPWRESFVQALQLLSSHHPWRASFARAFPETTDPDAISPQRAFLAQAAVIQPWVGVGWQGVSCQLINWLSKQTGSGRC